MYQARQGWSIRAVALPLSTVGILFLALRGVVADVPPGMIRPRPAAPVPMRLPQLPLDHQEAAAGHETEAETIAKCLADLETEDVDLRRRAVLILGKYQNPRAVEAIIACLEDSDDVVRQSALVALSEHVFIPLNARPFIPRLLADPNVHIRRIASSLLSEPGMLQTPSTPLQPSLPGITRAPVLNEETRQLVNRALGDEDAVVRRNVLHLHRIAGGLFEPERLLACLRDQDREIRVLALRAYRMNANLTDAGQLAVLSPLLNDPEAIVRQELVRTLGMSDSEGLPFLRELARDHAPEVRAQAIQRLAMVNDQSVPDHIEKALADPSMPLTEQRDLIRFLQLYPEQGLTLLLKVSAEGPVLLRAEAARVLGGMGDRGPDPAFFLALLDSPSAEIRRAAVVALRRRPERLSVDDIVSMFANRDADVRHAALTASVRLAAAEAVEVLTDALLDEDMNVRRTAIQLACEHSIADWRLYLEQSLKDPQIEIQRAAVEALLRRNDAAGFEILKQFTEVCTDAEMVAHIDLHLRRHEAEARTRALREMQVRQQQQRQQQQRQPRPRPVRPPQQR